jgi:hypothetical protein
MRLQITADGLLVAEVVGSLDCVDRVWQAYARAKYAAGLPIGAASTQRADLPRRWDVAIGEPVPRRCVCGRVIDDPEPPQFDGAPVCDVCFENYREGVRR